MTARIVRTRGVVGGRPRIDGTRLWTSLIWANTDDGRDPEQARRIWSHLTREQVDAAIRYERRWHRRLGRHIPQVTITIARYAGRFEDGREFTIGGWGW